MRLFIAFILIIGLSSCEYTSHNFQGTWQSPDKENTLYIKNAGDKYLVYINSDSPENEFSGRYHNGGIEIEGAEKTSFIKYDAHVDKLYLDNQEFYRVAPLPTKLADNPNGE